MTEEKILKDEILKDEQLNEVAGGTRLETFNDGNELFKRGLLSEDDALTSAAVRDLLHQMGYSGYKDKGGLINANEYFIGGKLVSRDDAWKHIEAQLKK